MTAQMNISIPEPMREWCEVQLKEGRFSTIDDYVQDLIRRDQEKQQTTHTVQSLIDKGMKSGISPHSLEEIIAIARKKGRTAKTNRS